VMDMLEKNVIILQPALNPDGSQRYAGWVNANLSLAGVTDPNTREFREPAPSSRTNHYWFDLNRDWLLAQHPESRSRLEIFHQWLPTMLNDYHEHGSFLSTFFSPGVRSRTNLLIPDENWVLTEKVSAYHSDILGEISVMHFTKESYDDFYLGKGSTYPDIFGAIGILYEQPNPRGVSRTLNDMHYSLSFSTRNQVFNSFSALKAAVDMKYEMQDFQRNYFTKCHKQAAKEPVQAYVFGTQEDVSLSREMYRMLAAHNIDVYGMSKEVILDGRTYKPGSAWVVPVKQTGYAVIKTLFERVDTFQDTVFYDISAWTASLAMNLPHAGVKDTKGLLGGRIASEEAFGTGMPADIPLSHYAYLIETTDFYNYTLLYTLMDKGVFLRVADQPFSYRVNGQEKEFRAGTVLVAVGQQKLSPQVLHQLIVTSCEQYKGASIGIHSVEAGLSTGGMDLGSNRFRMITKPSVALLTDRGATYGVVGEFWHLFDSRLGIPVSLIEADAVRDFSGYNVLIVAGNISLTKAAQERLQEWSSRPGNTFVAVGAGYRTLNEIGVSQIKHVPRQTEASAAAGGTYEESLGQRASSRVNGVILEAAPDSTHPLAFGAVLPTVPLFKNSDMVVAEPRSRFGVPVRYTPLLLMSGYLQKRYMEDYSGTPAVLVARGVVFFADNPVFRAYWHGSTRLFLNSIFYRELLPMGAL
ncbi:MAG: M14 family metallopeptidase, partial [Bacteroidales bacterium]